MIVFTSCIEEPTEKFEVPQQNPKLALVKNWFETHKNELRIGDSRDSYRTESNELILPFFEKEPDWDKFHIFQFPDGREVYEISLTNSELYFPVYLLDSLPGMIPKKSVIQNIMFVENNQTQRFDPLIVRYYPDNKESLREFEEIYYGMIDMNWSGMVDIWTYDERHFISFTIRDGAITSSEQTLPKDPESHQDIGANLLTTEPCREVVTQRNYVGSDGVVTVSFTVSYHCSGGGSSSGSSSGSTYGNDSGTTYTYTGPYQGGGSGSYGSVEVPTYTPPAITAPTVINRLTNPCASTIFMQIKKGGLISAVSASGTEFSKNILDLLNNSKKYDVVIQNSSNVEGNARTIPRQLNETTGKYDIMIELSNDYLSKATQLSIVRTIIHESIHAYLLHEGYTNPLGDLFSGLQRYSVATGTSSVNQIHHEFMPQYIDAIAFSLWSWDMANGSKGQIPLSYMKDLAWGGLTSYRDKNGNVQYYDSFKERFPNSSDRNRIEGVIKNESDGNNAAKSQKCP
ncbi:hypothetical protein, partial [Aquiflexum sp.]|uniref:hypothetical protein n=1 Tax=Aquiflexum sp. TaxID=1872584 RepID=UPI003593044B